MALRPPPLPEIVTTLPRGNVLVIAPHPDDEMVGPGGTLLHHARQGDSIRIIYVCSGIQGDPDGKFERDGYIALREAESRSSAEKHLQTTELAFYGYTDNLDDGDFDNAFEGLPDDPAEKRRFLLDGLATRLSQEIRDWDPRTVYYPWQGEFHCDHWAVGMAVEQLIANDPGLFENRSTLGYEVWTTLSPETLVDTTGSHAEKCEALGLFETQLAYHDLPEIVTGLAVHRGALLESPQSRFAEAFVGKYRVDEGDGGGQS